MDSNSSRVVGTGSMGSRYLRCLARMMKVRPIAVPVGGVLRDSGLAEVADLEQFNEPRRPQVDVCIVATNTNRHIEDAALFGDSANVLLIEKPLSYSRNSLREFDLSRPSSKVAVAAPLRFMEGFDTVRSVLGTVGVITGASVECRSWLPSWRPGTDFHSSYSADGTHGGVLLDLVHEIDYCLQLFGPPAGLSATLSHAAVLGIDSESTAHLLWRYASYDLHMVLDYVSRPPTRRLTVYGSSKSVTWDLLNGSVIVRDHDMETSEVLAFPDDLNRDLVLIRQILGVLARGGDARVSTVAQAWQAVAVCDLAKESGRQSGALLDVRAALEVPGAR